MRFLKKVFLPKKAQEGESNVLWLAVECSKCREMVRVRINKKTDLQDMFRKPQEVGPAFTLRKEILGNNCPNLIEVFLEFDQRYRILSKEVKNGRLTSLRLE